MYQERNETYIWGPCLFNVEAAKTLVRTKIGRPVYRITPNKKFLGLPVQCPNSADLDSPVIFASFLKLPKLTPGAVMIDGNKRVTYALKHKLPIRFCLLDPIETMNITQGFSQLQSKDWSILQKVAKILGVSFEPNSN
jgi:hypothetical protein